MAKYTLKILQCLNRKILIHERVKKRTKQILTHLGEVELLYEMLRKSHHAKVTKKIQSSTNTTTVQLANRASKLTL